MILKRYNSKHKASRQWHRYIGLLIGMCLCLAACMGTPAPIRVNPHEVDPVDADECGSDTCWGAPHCFGLFVDMQDRNSFDGHYSMTTQVYNGHGLRQRVYEFESGSPISVTTTLLVFGSGALRFPISDVSLDYQITVVDINGNEISKTQASRMPGRHPGISLGPVVTQYSPYMETFEISRWFDLLEEQSYTLYLTRTVYLSSTEVLVGGNPIYFHVSSDLDLIPNY